MQHQISDSDAQSSRNVNRTLKVVLFTIRVFFFFFFPVMNFKCNNKRFIIVSIKSIKGRERSMGALEV